MGDRAATAAAPGALSSGPPALSIVIPSHNDRYLHQTIRSLLDNARGSIEIIPVLDGYIPATDPKVDDRVRPIFVGVNKGMRESINRGVEMSLGEYIMRVDEHCMFGLAYDTILLKNIEPNWIVTPRRFYLDVEKWEVMDKPPVDYEKLVIIEKPDKGIRKFSGVAWPARTRERKDIVVDETMCMQGSCWVMPKSWWENVIVRLDSNGYGTHYQDTTEMLFKTWAAGGKLMVNKGTWFAHKHRSFNRTHQYPVTKAIPEWQFALDKHKEEYEVIRRKWDKWDL